MTELQYFRRPTRRVHDATLFDNGDFAYTADLVPVTSPAGGHCLTIRSRWRSAREPEAEQVSLQLCLDQEGLQALQGLLASAERKADRGPAP